MSLEVITIVALAAIPATVGVFGLVVYKIIEATQTVGSDKRWMRTSLRQTQSSTR
jgi:hypothetical protein